MELCKIDGCDRVRKYSKLGWCQTHYHRQWRTGTVELVPREINWPDLSYRGMHAGIHRLWGSASEYDCVRCGNKADQWAYDNTDPTEKKTINNGSLVAYACWPEFYMPMCRSCHKLLDNSVRPVKTHFSCGHERSGSNTYRPPSKPNAPECVTCRKSKSANRYQKRMKERT